MPNPKASLLVVGILGLLVWTASPSPAFAQEELRVVMPRPDTVRDSRDTVIDLRPAPNFLRPSQDPYRTSNQIANPYPIPYPNYVPNPVVLTPIVPAPIVPSPVVPNVNVAPNGPWTPGYPVSQPLLPPPPTFVTGPVIVMTPYGGPYVVGNPY